MYFNFPLVCSVNSYLHFAWYAWRLMLNAERKTHYVHKRWSINDNKHIQFSYTPNYIWHNIIKKNFAIVHSKNEYIISFCVLFIPSNRVLRCVYGPSCNIDLPLWLVYQKYGSKISCFMYYVMIHKDINYRHPPVQILLTLSQPEPFTIFMTTSLFTYFY